MASLPQTTVLPGETVRCGLGSGYYGSSGALAFGCAAKASENLFLNVGAALANTPGFNGSVALKAGFSWGFGRSSNQQGQKKKEDENAKVIQTLQEKIALLETSIQVLKLQKDSQNQDTKALGIGDTQLAKLNRQKSALEVQLQAKLTEQQKQLREQTSIITAQSRQIQQQNQLLEAQQRQLDAFNSRLQQLEQKSLGTTPHPLKKPIATPISQLTTSSR
jgi:hypothetical protein